MIQRHILDTDRALLNEWIAKDPHHRDTTTADFFFEEGTLCNLYSDAHGPVFFMRGEPFHMDGMKVIKLDIQFDNDQESRNARTLIQVNKVFSEQAKKAGFKELVFESNSPRLIAFCKRALGFVEIDGALIKCL